MLKKFFLILTLILVPLTANAELYVDANSQIEFDIPQGWKVLTDREKADNELSLDTIYLAPKNSSNGAAVIVFEITKTTDESFLSTNSSAKAQQSADLWREFSSKNLGYNVVDSRVYPSPAGNGIVAAFLSGKFFHLEYKISSPRHSIHLRYYTHKERARLKESKVFDLCFSLINSIKFPE